MQSLAKTVVWMEPRELVFGLRMAPCYGREVSKMKYNGEKTLIIKFPSKYEIC